MEEFVTRYVDMVSTIQNPSMPSLGRFSCEFPALPDRAYALEYSSDLKTWTKGLEFYSEGGVYAFLDGGARNAPYRFYRLVELYKFAVVKGVVRDACSLAPIPNAEVTATPYIDFPRQTVATDSQGRFTLRLFRSEYYQNIPWQYYWDISARALGYNATWHYGGDETELNLNLLPTSAPRPVNADFSGRLPLTGLPATLTSANCGTDFSPNNAPSLGHWVVWFTWTAPVSGRVAIHAERASGEISYNLPLLSVFTGTTTNNLSLVVSSAWEVRFEATAGTTYQIAVGQSYYGRPGQFTLRISSPPSLNWSAPADGTEFVALATIPFSVSPTDLDGNIVKVRYFANGEKIAELGAAPFDFVWENVPANMYELEARARDAQGLVTSEYRQVAVRPPNDHFAGRIPIEGAPLRVKGSNKAATLEPGEAGHISQSIWWRWRTPVAGDYTIVAEGADGDDRRATLLAVYTGLALNQLSLVVSNQIEDDDLPLQVSFAAQSQTDYQIVVDGYRGDEVQLRILPTAPPQVALLTPTNNARFIAPASIFVQVDATDADNNLSSVELFGNARLLQAYPGPFSFQWTNVPAGWYTLKARAIDAWGVENFSTPVAIQVRPPPPPNDDFADRIVLTESSGVLSGTTDAATKEAGEPNTGYGFSGNSVWWTWTAPANGTLILDDVLSTWYKQVHVFRGNSVSALSTVDYDVGYSTWLATFVQAGVVYQICVEGMYGHSGPVQINLQFNP